jgi:hypothetical protein
MSGKELQTSSTGLQTSTVSTNKQWLYFEPHSSPTELGIRLLRYWRVDSLDTRRTDLEETLDTRIFDLDHRCTGFFEAVATAATVQAAYDTSVPTV